MNLIKMKAQLVKHEGVKLTPYRCTAGKLTIGVGRNIQDKGITPDEADFLLQNDVRECLGDLGFIFQFDYFNSLPENIQMVLLDMRFNLGSNGFREFVHMIKAVKVKDWDEMIFCMKSSKWFHQVGNRGTNLVKMVDQVIKGGM